MGVGDWLSRGTGTMLQDSRVSTVILLQEDNLLQRKNSPGAKLSLWQRSRRCE